MCRTAEQVAETGSMSRKRAKGHKQGASVPEEEVVCAAGEAVTRSLRCLARQSGLSNSNACKVCREDLFWRKMQLSRPVPEDRTTGRSVFGTEERSGVVECQIVLQQSTLSLGRLY
jgi:hypothetical protein